MCHKSKQIPQSKVNDWFGNEVVMKSGGKFVKKKGTFIDYFFHLVTDCVSIYTVCKCLDVSLERHQEGCAPTSITEDGGVLDDS